MGFWFIFMFFGLIAIPLIIMFLACGVDTKHKLVGSFIVLVFWFAIAGGLYFQDMKNAKEWNGGFCSCGGHWELVAASKSHYGAETKYYACKNCYKEIEINP